MPAPSFGEHIGKLGSQIEALTKRNEELNIELMRKSAELSEAREEAERLCNLIKLHRAQEGHNRCWKNDYALHKAVGNGVPCTCPNPDKVSLPEFLTGCLYYAPDQFKGVSPKHRQMIEDLLVIVRRHHLEDLVSKSEK